LYHLEYAKARDQFDLYNQKNPNDPAGYFFKTATDWWQLAQEYDQQLPQIEQQLEEDYQTTVKVADVLLDTATDARTRGLACLYEGGAQGLKGRWLVTQHPMGESLFHREKADTTCYRKALEYDPTLYDAYLGLGIYDYFTDTLPGAKEF